MPDDLPDCGSSGLKLFAEDTKFYKSVGQASDHEALQRDLDALLRWSEKWQLSFNHSKCKSLHLGSRNTNHTYHMGDTQLNQTLVEKDLGV